MKGVADVVGTWFLKAAAPESFTLSGDFLFIRSEETLDLSVESVATTAVLSLPVSHQATGFRETRGDPSFESERPGLQ